MRTNLKTELENAHAQCYTCHACIHQSIDIVHSSIKIRPEQEANQFKMWMFMFVFNKNRWKISKSIYIVQVCCSYFRFECHRNIKSLLVFVWHLRACLAHTHIKMCSIFFNLKCLYRRRQQEPSSMRALKYFGNRNQIVQFKFIKSNTQQSHALFNQIESQHNKSSTTN